MFDIVQKIAYERREIMNNVSKYLAIGLVLGGGIGIVVGNLMGNLPMGIVFGGGAGLVLGLAFGKALDRGKRGAS